MLSRSVIFNSLQPHGLQTTRLFCPWNFPGKNTGVGYYFLGFPDSSVGEESVQCRRPQFYSRVRKIPWRRDRLPTPVFLGFRCGSAGKESTCNAGDLGLIPELRRSPGEGILLQSNSIKSLKIMTNNI